MYDYLLTEGDKLRKLPKIIAIDLEDYINMRKQCLTRQQRWLSIRSIWVTEYGVTVWQLTEKYLNSEPARAIGQIEPPISLISWMLQK